MGSRRSAILLLLLAGVFLPHRAAAESDPPAKLVELGRSLFFDTRFSEPPGTACATCHDPGQAYSDPRRHLARGAVSTGADGRSPGRRNAPTLTYVALVPDFHLRAGEPVGGFFLDGRAATLIDQVKGPLYHPREMAIADERSLARRIRSDPAYRAAIASLYGAQAPDSDARTIQAVYRAIAAYERSAELGSFDSRWDRARAGELTLGRDESLGAALFFSNLTNCSLCHLNEPGRISQGETFTNHHYRNIGIPANPALSALPGWAYGEPDPGLGAHWAAAGRGRFRVPTLRNVAVTAPYMHNGVFQTLEAAVAFYGRYLATNGRAELNPESRRPWGPPEVAENLATDELTTGQPLGPERIRQLVAFLKALTDRRYEHLIE